MVTFEPEQILPSQFTHGRSTACDGYRRLWVATLEKAIDDACMVIREGNSPAMTRLRAIRDDARKHILSDDRRSPFTFLTLCDVLGLHGEHIRSTLERNGWAVAYRLRAALPASMGGRICGSRVSVSGRQPSPWNTTYTG